MAKKTPDTINEAENNTVETKTENLPVVTREELRQAKREAKAAKKKAAIQKAESETTDGDSKQKKAAPAKAANGTAKPKLGQRIAKTFKEMISELKKVTWPTWKTVVKSTTVVIVVVLFFLIVLTAMDAGLGALLKLLTKSAGM